MKTRNEIKEAIENRILLGDLSREQIGHLRSELTVRRILNGERSIEEAVDAIRDLSPYTDNAKRLIACGWLPEEFANETGGIFSYGPQLHELFSQGLLTPRAAKKMADIYVEKPKFNFLALLAAQESHYAVVMGIQNPQFKFIKLVTRTSLTCDELVELGYSTIKSIFQCLDEVILFMKYNCLTVEELRCWDQEGALQPTPAALPNGFDFSWYVLRKIREKYEEYKAKMFTSEKRNQVKEIIGRHIAAGGLSREQISHLNSELTVGRALNNTMHSFEAIIQLVIDETNDLTDYTWDETGLIASGWLPSEIEELPVDLPGDKIYPLHMLFALGYLMPSAAIKFSKMVFNGDNLILDLRNRQSEYLNIVMQTPFACDKLVELSGSTICALLQSEKEVVFLAKYNALMFEDVKRWDSNLSELEKRHYYTIENKIKEKYNALNTARKLVGFAARNLSQGMRDANHPISKLVDDVVRVILSLVDAVQDQDTLQTIKTRYTGVRPKHQITFFNPSYIDPTKTSQPNHLRTAHLNR